MPSVAVPEVDIVTVISSSAIGEAVAVKVTVAPEFSATDDVDEVNVIVGADSFSVMIIDTDCEPLSAAPPPDTDDIDIVAVSSPS